MARRSLVLLFLLVLSVGWLTPVATRAEPPRAPLVLIHGHGGSADLTWKTAFLHLEQRGYRRGVDLFAVDLAETRAADYRLGLLSDAQVALERIYGVLEQTGAEQVDLVGHSRGGLIVRLLATGSTAGLVRRAVTMNTPHQGALTADELTALLTGSGLQQRRKLHIAVPPDLQSGSDALQFLHARERHYGDRRVPALAVATTWRKEAPAVLQGHDGAVPVTSQLAWPGARTALFPLGPTPEEIETMLQSDLAAGLLVWNSPHLQSHESAAVLNTVADFLLAQRALPARRPCDPGCGDWAELRGHWSEQEILPHTADLVPYEVADDGRRFVEPERLMTRAEFLAGLVQALGLRERLSAPRFADMAGHWAFGWTETGLEAKLLEPGERFEPDRPITRAEAAAMVVRVKGLPEGSRPSRFPDVQGHRSEADIEALVALGLLQGDEDGFRPDDHLSMAEGAVLLVRAFRR